jgi:hypothetical protein
MKDKRAGVYYVDIHVEGADRANYLVETGAADMTINEDTLSALQADDDATDAKHKASWPMAKLLLGPFAALAAFILVIFARFMMQRPQYFHVCPAAYWA